MENSADPDQMALSEANLSGSRPFSKEAFNFWIRKILQYYAQKFAFMHPCGYHLNLCCLIQIYPP